MMTLEEMGIEVKGAVAMVRGFLEVFRGMASESCLDDDAEDELFSKTLEAFAATIKRTFENKYLLLWCEPEGASVYVLDSMRIAQDWKSGAEELFERHPIPDSDDPEYDEFLRRSRFACIITYDQFDEFAGDDLYNLNCYCVDETGLSYCFTDTTAITRARESGRI